MASFFQQLHLLAAVAAKKDDYRFSIFDDFSTTELLKHWL